MQNYIGYGFDIDDIRPEQWLDLLKEHDMASYNEFVHDVRDENPDADDEEFYEILLDEVEDFISLAIADSLEDYFATIINEGFNAVVVNGIDGHVVFESLRFAEDEPRANIIRKPDDFIKAVSEYLPDISGIQFGNVYTGISWVDPEYYIG